MEKISDALIAYFRMQKAAGADAIQIFDSWGGILAGEDYEAASLKWIRKVIDSVREEVPIIIYAKGTTPQIARQAACQPKAIAVDWTIPIEEAAALIPHEIAIQGNLDPVLLDTQPAIVETGAKRILTAMKDRPGHIFNLGHGIHPTARIENMETLVNTVVNWQG